jgi:hypothetical protein
VNPRTRHLLSFLFLIMVTLAVAACGGGDTGSSPDGATPPGQNDGGGLPGGDGGGLPGSDGGGLPGSDGGVQPIPGCGDPAATQCNNCMDDDNDGLTDGEDPHCITAADDDESSFATGLPGDNRDPKPDCFFDGNSGSGNDNCSIELCCLLGNCAPNTNCSVTQRCIDFCAPATPVGCDCFGCCTICWDGTCKDVLTIPGATPGWDCDDLENNLGDPTKCPQCTKVTECSSSCDEAGQNADCILCPGQSPDELPDACNMQNECPDGRQVCSDAVACPSGQYCASGCCINIVIE